MPASTSTPASATFFSAATGVPKRLRRRAGSRAQRCQPGRLQRRDDVAVARAPRRAWAPPRRLARMRSSGSPSGPQLGGCCDTCTSRIGCARAASPGARAVQQLHAAERERERARVARDVVVGGRASNSVTLARGRRARRAAPAPARPGRRRRRRDSAPAAAQARRMCVKCQDRRPRSAQARHRQRRAVHRARLSDARKWITRARSLGRPSARGRHRASRRGSPACR